MGGLGGVFFAMLVGYSDINLQDIALFFSRI